MQEEKKGLELEQNMFKDISHAEELIKDEKKEELMKYDNQECVQVNQEEDQSLKVVQDKSQKISNDKKEGLLEFKSHEHTNNQSQGITKDQKQEEIRKNESKELKQDQSQDVTKELSPELSKDQIKEGLQVKSQKLSTDNSLELPKEESQKLPKYESQEFMKDQSQIVVQDQSPDAFKRNSRNDQSQDMLQVKCHELPNDNSIELAMNQYQELSKDESQNISKDKGQEFLLNNEKENKDDDVQQSNVEMGKQNTMHLEEQENRKIQLLEKRSTELPEETEISEKMLRTKIQEAAHQFKESLEKIANDKNKENLEKEVNCDISVTENKITQVSENLEIKADAPSLPKTNIGNIVENKSNITLDNDVITSVPCSIQEKSACTSKTQVSKIESSNKVLLPHCQENNKEIDLLECQKVNVKKKAEVPSPKDKDDEDMTKKTTSKGPGCVTCEYLENEVNCECDISVTENKITQVSENLKTKADAPSLPKTNTSNTVEKKSNITPGHDVITSVPCSIQEKSACKSKMEVSKIESSKEEKTFDENSSEKSDVDKLQNQLKTLTELNSMLLTRCQENKKELDLLKCQKVNVKNKAELPSLKDKDDEDMTKKTTSKGLGCIVCDDCLNTFREDFETFKSKHISACDFKSVCKKDIIDVNTKNTKLSKRDFEIRLQEFEEDIMDVVDCKGDNTVNMLIKLGNWSKVKFDNMEEKVSENRNAVKTEISALEHIIVEKISTKLETSIPIMLKDIKGTDKVRDEMDSVERRFDKTEMENFMKDVTRLRNKEIKDIENCKSQMEKTQEEMLKMRDNEIEEIKKLKEDILRNRIEEKDEMRRFREDMIRKRNEEKMEMEKLTKELIRNRNEETELMKNFKEDLIRQRNEEHEEMKIFRKELIRQRNEEKEEMVKLIEEVTGRKEKYDRMEEEEKEIQNEESDKGIKQNDSKPACLEELIIKKIHKLEAVLNTKIEHVENRIDEVLNVEVMNGKTLQSDEQCLKQKIETKVSQRFILEKIDDLKLRRTEDMLDVKKITDDMKNQMTQNKLELNNILMEDRVDMKERIKDLKHEMKEIKSELKEKMRDDKVDTIRNLENVAEHLKLFSQTEFSHQFASCKTANYAELKKISTEIDQIKETFGSFR